VKEKLRSGHRKLQIGEIALLDIYKLKDDTIKENNTEISHLKKNIQYLEEANKLLAQEKTVASNVHDKDTREFYHQIERFIGSRIF